MRDGSRKGFGAGNRGQWSGHERRGAGMEPAHGEGHTNRRGHYTTEPDHAFRPYSGDGHQRHSPHIIERSHRQRGPGEHAVIIEQDWQVRRRWRLVTCRGYAGGEYPEGGAIQATDMTERWAPNRS